MSEATAHISIYDDPAGTPDEDGNVCFERPVTRIRVAPERARSKLGRPATVHIQFFIDGAERQVNIEMEATAAREFALRIDDTADKAEGE